MRISVVAGGALLALATLSVCGCAFVTRTRSYPTWRAPPEAQKIPLACGTATPVVTKTGKTGIGVTMIFDGGEQTCVLALTGVAFIIDGREVSRAAPPPLPTLAPGVRVEMYFPLPFDENASFNAGERTGALVLEDGTTKTPFPLVLIADPEKTR